MESQTSGVVHPGRSCLHLHLEAVSVVKVNLTRGPSLARLWRPQLVVSPCAESYPLAPCVDVGGGADRPIRRPEHIRIFAYSHIRIFAYSHIRIVFSICIDESTNLLS